MQIDSLNDYLQVFSHLVTIVGLPLAIYLFFHERRKERKEREYGTYNALDDKYIHFLELCLEKPELDVFDLPVDPTQGIKKRQEQILFLILISILERAFLMYSDQNNRVKKRQWEGWEEYIKDYCKRENFKREWPNLGSQFDTEFVAFVNSVMLRQRDNKTSDSIN